MTWKYFHLTAVLPVDGSVLSIQFCFFKRAEEVKRKYSGMLKCASIVQLKSTKTSAQLKYVIRVSLNVRWNGTVLLTLNWDTANTNRMLPFLSTTAILCCPHFRKTHPHLPSASYGVLPFQATFNSTTATLKHKTAQTENAKHQHSLKHL